jgi:hypothetical protein
MFLVHGEDRTRSLSIRSRAPYPLGHADIGESQNRTGVDAATTRSTTTILTHSTYLYPVGQLFVAGLNRRPPD